MLWTTSGRYRVDYGPFTTEKAARFLPAGIRGLAFRPSWHWTKRSALRTAQTDGHPETTVTDVWLDRQVDWSAVSDPETMPADPSPREQETVDSDEIRAERDFLLARAVSVHLHYRDHDVGLSSQAMLLWALGCLPRPVVPGRPTRLGGHTWEGVECGRWYPHDPDDLARCERTYAAAPPHLQARMLPVLEEFRAYVHEGRNRYGEMAR